MLKFGFPVCENIITSSKGLKMMVTNFNLRCFWGKPSSQNPGFFKVEKKEANWSARKFLSGLVVTQLLWIVMSCGFDMAAKSLHPSPHREDGGYLPWDGGPFIINPIYTLYSEYSLGISPFKGLLGSLNS